MSNFLTETERIQLYTQLKSERNSRVSDRIKAVLLYDKGWFYKDIAEALFLNEETVSRHVKEYKFSEKLSVDSGGSACKLSEDQTILLTSHVEAVTYTKVSDICSYVKEAYNISYTVSGMTHWLKVHGFTYKQPNC